MREFYFCAFMKKIKFLDIIVFLFIVLFVYAATSKLLTFDVFRAQIGNSPMIQNYATAIAYAVPFVEILISLMLVIPRMLLYGLYGSFFLMLTFTGYIICILTISPYVPCSCGGILDNMGWTEHLIFNIGFVLLAVVGIALYCRQKNVSPAKG